MEAGLSKSDREVLKAIYRLSHQAPVAEVHTGALAEALKLTPGTASATVKRLALRGLVDHQLYRSVNLTVTGSEAAVAAIRRHRLVERLLADLLGYAWHEADRLAKTFEHELPDEVVDRLYEALHQPSTCPHGFPIPPPEVAEIPTLPLLYDLEPGDLAVVAVPGSLEAEVVDYLESLGIRPGVRVEVVEKHPLDGPLVVRVEGEQQILGDKVARQVHVVTEHGAARPGTPHREISPGDKSQREEQSA